MIVPIVSQKSWVGGEEMAVAGLVSVIIPNYNHANYIPQAIDSVLQQTYQLTEIIVVDDGSTDHSRQVVAVYGDQVRYIWQENQGLSAARNTGLRAARGEFIALLDADDTLEPEYLTTLLGFLNGDPSADGIICGYRFWDDNMNPLPQKEARYLLPDSINTMLLDGNFLAAQSILLRRYCYATAGPFDETLQACEDWDMWLRISSQFCILSTQQLLTRVRVLSGSMSSDPKRMLTNRLAVLNRHFGAEPRNAQDGEPAQRRAYARAYLASAVEYLQNRDLDNAASCLRQMAHIAPHILTELDTFYELALGDQPKGWRGHFASLDLAWSERMLESLLSRLFTETPAILPYRRTAYSQAHSSLALLYYGARQPAQVRRHMWRSFLYWPQQIGKRKWRTTLLKSLLSARLVQALRAKQGDRWFM